jgi:hypothetical protein
MTDQKQRFLITDVRYCEEGMSEKWSNTLIYDVLTEESGRIILELTIDAAKKLRVMPNRLPPWRLGKLGKVWE